MTSTGPDAHAGTPGSQSEPDVRRSSIRRIAKLGSLGRERLTVLVCFAIATIVMTWPMVIQLGTHVDNPGDPIFTSWILPWNINALLHHPTSLFQANIFHPEPNTLAYADHMLALVPIATPFWLLTHNGIFTNNATVLILMTLAGWSAYLLCRDITGSWSSAILGGVIFGFSPFHFARVSHTNILSTWGFPLAWLFARRLVRRQRWVDAVGLGVSCVIAMYSSWYYLVFVGVLVSVVLGAEVLAGWREVSWRRLFLHMSLTGAIVLVGILAVARPYFAVQDRYPQATRSLEEAVHYSAVPSSLITAPSTNRLYGDVTQPFRDRSAGYNERMMFLGIVPTVLAVVGLGWSFRRRRWDVVIASLGVLTAAVAFAFGPFQEIRGQRVHLPFYYLYKALPPLQFMRSPGRASLMVYLAMAVLGSYLVSRLRSRTRPLIVAALIAIVAVEYSSAPLRLTPVEESPGGLPALVPSAAHHRLAQFDGPGAVLELPTGVLNEGAFEIGSLLREGAYMYFSTVHWRPLLNGYSGFAPPTYREMVEILRSFPDEPSIALLRERDVAFLVVHHGLLSGTPWEDLQDGIRSGPLELVMEDSDVRLYRLLPT